MVITNVKTKWSSFTNNSFQSCYQCCIDYGMGKKHNVNDRVSADSQSHPVTNYVYRPTIFYISQ